MAEFDHTKSLAIDNRNTTMEVQLVESFKNASSIDMIVSFVMDSGIKALESVFQEAKHRGIKIRLLTSTYLNITSPTALYRIKKEFDELFEIRIYNDSARSFHPKAYFFHKDHDDVLYIGSSNLSLSALKTGVEWNYRFSKMEDPANYRIFYDDFEYLWSTMSIPLTHRYLKQYASSWKKMVNIGTSTIGDSSAVIEPRGVQIEALYELERSRKEGAKKGLIHAATGIGKTYLAAFDSKPYKKVLFIAHRKEILHQAKDSFEKVRSGSVSFFDADHKSLSGDVVLASVQTLGNPDYLKEIPTDYFDYIIIDEFHHAVTTMYRNIIGHFKPKFLLGLTATPERMDGRSIYEICDYNVPYEIDLKTAINREILVPFHYYGIYDETDFSNYRYKREMSVNDLDQVLLGNKKRIELIIKHYRNYASRRALGFCSSKRHAQEMAEAFNEAGIKSMAIYSGSPTSREEALRRLKEGSIQVLFSVDMFNEGMDIKEIDMVMLLRPTQSSTIFLQQIGRGLRTAPHKKYVNILDFIGNYKNSNLALKLLSGNSRIVGDAPIETIDFPSDCIVDIDLQLIDLFKSLKSGLSIQTRIDNEYDRIKEDRKRIPTRMDLFNELDEELYSLMLKNAKLNVFRNYVDYVARRKEPLQIGDPKLIKTIDRTSMNHSYKMPVLQAFIEDDHLKKSVSEEELLAQWKSFYDQNGNWRDFDLTYEEYKKKSDRWHLSMIKRNPCQALEKSGNGYFFWKDDRFYLTLKDEEYKNKELVAQFKDSTTFRIFDYYKRRYEADKESIEK